MYFFFSNFYRGQIFTGMENLFLILNLFTYLFSFAEKVAKRIGISSFLVGIELRIEHRNILTYISVFYLPLKFFFTKKKQKN